VTRRPLLAALVSGFVLAHLALWWRAIHWFPQLPERFPIHFDAAGTPDGWSTNHAAWFLLPAISLGLSAFLGAIARWSASLARNAPALFNVPRKELFLKLSPDGRARVAGPTQAFMAWLLMLLQLLFLYILEGSGRVAVGLDATLPSWPVFVFLGLVFATLPVYLIGTIKVVDRCAADEGILSDAGGPRAR